VAKFNKPCNKYVNISVVFYTGISKYLRHSETVSAKHYDFGIIEQSARNRAAIVNLVGGKPAFYCCFQQL